MTLSDTAELMDLFTDAYPQFYKNQSPTEKQRALKLWAAMFANDDVEIVLAATKVLIASDTKGFPPVIGQIKEKIRFIAKVEELNELKAWELVNKAISNSYYHAKEEFDRLPQEIQAIVGSPNMLRQWGMSDIDDVQTVIQSNFMRSYRAKIVAIKEYSKIPEDIKKMIGGMVNQLHE